jgi:fructose-bisphosphate aldolase class II
VGNIFDRKQWEESNMLVTLKEICEPYLASGKSVGAFNVTTYADAQPVIDAAQARNAPVIVQVGAMATAYMDTGLWGKLLAEMARRASVPVCTHLDHAKNLDLIQQAIDAGFSSVMIDGSHLPYEDNVAITKETVRRALATGVSVEGEIGSVAYSGNDTIKGELSDPDTTARFVKDTGINAVAIAVGTLHRMERQGSRLDFDRISAIEAKVKIPLVIHGSSGLLDEEYYRMRETRVCKVNIGTALRMAFDEGLRKALANNPKNYVTTDILGIPMKSVYDAVTCKLELLGF